MGGHQVRQLWGRRVAIGVLCLGGLFTAGCGGDDDGETTGVVSDIGEKAEEAGDAAQDAANDAEDAAKDAGAKAGDAVDDAADAAEGAEHATDGH